MKDQKLKRLDKFFDESEQFEKQFEQLHAGEENKSERKRLIDEIHIWLQDCANQGRFIPGASADRRALMSLFERWNSRLRAQGCSIEGIDRLDEFDPNAGVVLKVDCPYPGLEPYTQLQSGSFFGREAFVSSSVAHLEQQGNRILMMIGASGSGKSSAALAGILPRLKELHDGAWLFDPPDPPDSPGPPGPPGPRLTPGAHPLKELASSIARAIGRPDQATEIERGLAAEPGEALGRLAEWCEDKPLMLLIDQFEELFTLCRDEGERSAFAQVLCALSDPAASLVGFSCRILLTLRTDHLTRLESSDTLKPLHMRLAGENNIFYLSTIGFDDIKCAIKKPADEVGLRFIPEGLIGQLASQTAGLSNGLPLLQFSLRRLWDTRPKNESGEPLDLVTEKMVKDLPDVARALGTVADGVFDTFNPSQKEICERLLLELLVLDESFEAPLRRRRNETELEQVLQALSPGPGDVSKVIDEFVGARLLRRFGDRPNCQLEVAHEALLRHWDHIYLLLTGAQVKERLHLIKQIGRQASEWASHDNSCDYLSLRGERLQRALKYAADGWLAEAEATSYVEACRMQEKADRRKDKQAAWSRRLMWVAATITVCVLFGCFVYLKWVRPVKEMQRIAESNKHMSYGFYLLQADDPRAEDRFRKADKLGQGQLALAKLASGLFSLRKAHYKEAKICFQQLIDLTPKEDKTKDSKQDSVLYTYHYNKGKSCRGLLEHEGARDSFIEAIRLMTESNPDDKNLADYYYNLGLSYLDLKKMEDARNAFNRGLSLGGDKEAANIFGLGQVYFRNGDFHAASAEFDKAINLLLKAKNKNYKDLLVYHYHLSLSYRGLGDTEAAEKTLPFNKGVAWGEDMVAAYRDGLGQLYVRQENFPAAITEFIEASNLAENEPSYHTNLGLAYLASGDWQGTIKVFANVVEKDPGNASAWLCLTQAYVSEAKKLKEGKENEKTAEYSKKAEDAANKALAIPELKERDKQKASALLAESLAPQGKYREAIMAYEDLCKSNPQDAFLALYLAEAHIENKNRREAKNHVETAKELAKSYPEQLQAQKAREFFDKKLAELNGKLNSR